MSRTSDISTIIYQKLWTILNRRRPIKQNNQSKLNLILAEIIIYIFVVVILGMEYAIIKSMIL